VERGKQQQQTFKFVKFSSMKMNTISCEGNFQWVHVTLPSSNIPAVFCTSRRDSVFFSILYMFAYVSP
jgi:hypothetical protein